MITAALLSLAAACPLSDAPPAPATDSLRAFWEAGRTWTDFYAAVTRRAAMWRANYGKGFDDQAELARARGLTGPWRVLIVTVDGCSDSANTLPYLASLVDSLGGTIEFRIIDPDRGKGIMEAHRTRDGRPATATLLLLDQGWNEVGCWVERPSALAHMMAEQRGKLSDDELLERKFAWYDEDRGRSTVREFLDMIEHAAPGAPCGGGA